MEWYVGLGIFFVVAILLVAVVLVRRRDRPRAVRATAHPRRNTGTEKASHTRHGSRERRERKRRRKQGAQTRRKRH